MSVFQDVVRINEAFADVVNWDLLPKSAVASMQLLPGSSPIFGLSTLGGALTIAMKDGFARRGVDLEASTGSFGRTELAAEAGGNDGRFGFYVAAEGIDDDGYRDHSSSRIRRMYARGDAHAGDDELGVGVTLADNHLEGTQALPVSMFGDPRQAYTWPDTTKNRLLFVNANRQRIDNLFDTALQNFGILGANYFRGPGGTFSTTLAGPEPFRAPGSAFGAWIGVRYALAERR